MSNNTAVDETRQTDEGGMAMFGGNQPANTGSARTEIESARAVQEVQASLVIAKKFPRDEVASFNRIMKACDRPTLSEKALYAYPRGGELVTGPSIRMAEMLAQNWGNLNFGIQELSQDNGASVCRAYCWDLETNTRQEKEFTVPHKRHTKRGVTNLTDPRDIYEMVANQGARRMRACILGVIPGDIVEAAVDRVTTTLSGGGGEPLADRLRKMVAAFDKDFSVSQDMIEKRLGHKISATTETELVTLKGVYRSLRDGMAKRADFFDVAEESGTAKNLNETLESPNDEDKATDKPKAKSGSKAKTKQPDEEPPPAATDDAAPSYAEIADAINKAGDEEALNEALSLAGHLPEDQVDELANLAQTRRQALETA